MEDLKLLIDKINETNFEEESEVLDLIKNTSNGIYSGTNTEGQTIIVELIKNKYIRIATHQYNGWIRINQYYNENTKKHNLLLCLQFNITFTLQFCGNYLLFINFIL